MTVSYVSAGAIAYPTVTTSVAAVCPTGIAANNMLVAFVGLKADTASASTPAGWTALGNLAGGGGTTGADTGPTRLYAFYKKALGTESGTTITFTLTTANTAWAQIYRLSNGTGDWDMAAAFGADDTTGTAWSATCSTNPGITSGDLLLVGSVIPTDVTTPAQFTAEAVTATGATFGTMTEISEPDTTFGSDLGGFVFRQPVTGGTATAAPVVTATATGTTTNVRGISGVVRIRQVGADPVLPIPTFEEVQNTTWTAGGAKSLTMTCTAGDVLVLYAGNEQATSKVQPPTGGLTWTERAFNPGATGADSHIFTATVPSSGSQTITCQNGTGPTTVDLWGFGIIRFSGSTGIGAVGTAGPTTGAPSLTLTGVVANSAIVHFHTDYAAVAPGSPVYLTADAGAFTETAQYTSSGRYTLYGGYHASAGAAGTKIVGQSAPTGQNYCLVAVEVKGTTGGPLTYPRSYAGTVTPTGAPTKRSAKAPSGSTTPTGATAKQTAKRPAGTITPTSTVATIRAALRTFAGTVTPTATAVRRAGKLPAGTVGSSGTLARSTARSQSGSTTPTGIARKRTDKSYAGTAGASGTVSFLRAVLRAFGGTVTPTAAHAKRTAKRPAGSMTPTGALARRTAKAFAGSSTPSAILQTALTAGTILRSFAGTLTPTAALVRRTASTKDGATTPAGNVAKSSTHAYSGSTTPTGTVGTLRALLRSFAGSTTPTSVLRRRTSKPTAGTVTPTSSLARRIATRFAGTVAPAATVARRIARTLSGTVTAVGSIVADNLGTWTGSTAGNRRSTRRTSTASAARPDATVTTERDATATTRRDVL
jgi:hypothetical protein